MAKIKMIICDSGVSNDFFDIRPQLECKHLIQKGHEVEVVILYREEDKTTPAKVTINDIDCVFLNCRGKITDWLARGIFKNKNNLLYPFWFIVFIFKLKAYLDNNPADFLNTHNLYGTIAGYIAKKKKQKIVFDMREFFGMQGESGVLATLKKGLSMLLCKISYRILYVHPLQKEEAPPETQYKFLHLPNYPDTDCILPLDKARPDNAPLYVSYIGGLRERQKEYFEILAKACAEVGSIKLALHGGGNGYPEVLYLQDKYPDIVKVTGQYDGLIDTSRLFAECDLLYCCYDISVINWKRAEPIKMFEAIATKTPVVVSRDSYVESFVIKNDIGYILDGGNYNEMLSFLRHVVDNRGELKLKAKNIERIMKQYSWKNVVHVLDEVYS